MARTTDSTGPAADGEKFGGFTDHERTAMKSAPGS
jgi:hypothetical protein